MSNIDALLITPPSRLDIYQGLADEYAAIEPPVWSSLIANFLIKKGLSADVLDAEAENLTYEQTAKKIAKKNPKLAIFMVYGQQPSASTQCMPGGKKTCLRLNEITSGEIKSIVIGTHASALPKKTLEEEPYNYVCQGEGPLTVLELINFLKGKTKDLKNECSKGDIVIAAVGIPELVKADWIKKDAIVIDVGINKTDKGIVGDVAFEEVSKNAKALTPVPGGVGPMTIACLLKNTITCFRRFQK